MTSQAAILDSAPVSTASFAGAIIDARYEVIRPIAKGGMGQVLDARHLQTGRPVALKVLRMEMCGRTDVVARLQREARALGTIQHPGVISILDAGTCARFGPFVALERLEGRSLDGLLTARGGIGVPGAVLVVRSLATTLAEVHRLGFVHRDLKPSNVFIASVRGHGELIKLLDFGVVGHTSGSDEERITSCGDLLGTMGYMAPEQLANVSDIDARSDFYSLGVLALECLGVSLDRLMGVRRLPRPASAAIDKSLNLPEGLVDLLDDLLSLDKHARPRNAEEILSRLASVDVKVGPLLAYASPLESSEAPTDCEPASLRGAQNGAGRRKHMRAPYMTPARISADGVDRDGHTEDISRSGLLLICRSGVDFKGKLTVRFAAPTTGRITSLAARIAWTRQQNGRTALGVEFLDLDAEIAESIDTYVRYFATEG